MVRTRPTVILVMAILSIVFGCLGLLFWLCTGATPFVVYHVPVPQPGGGTTYPMREFYDLLLQQVPAYVAVEVANFALGLTLTVLLILSGIGLLGMRTWARWTSVIYSIVTIIRGIAHFVFTVAVVNPIAERWTEDFLRRQPRGTPNLAGNSVMNAIISSGQLGVSITFALVLLFVMFLPSVSAAFASQGSGPAKAEEGGYSEEPAGEGG